MFKQQYKCEYDEEVDYFIISWNDEDNNLIYQDNIIDMDNDYGTSYKLKTNMFWIDDIKKHYNWKNGECIYLNMKQNCDNAFYVFRGCGYAHKREEQPDKFCIAIDEDGFVIKRYYQHYSFQTTKNITRDFVARPSCIYNDYWVDEI